MTVAWDGRTSTVVPAGYLDAGHLDHGYAITGHRAQGLTVDRTWVQTGDTLYREWGYVAASRGHHHNQLYATAELNTEPLDLGAWQSERAPATEQLTNRVRRGQAQQSATDILRRRVTLRRPTAPVEQRSELPHGRDYTLGFD